MKNDFEMIIKRFNKNIVIYPISDIHLGALEHNQVEWEKFIAKIKSESNSYIILGGDLINNATRSSVSNVFEDTMRPQTQKEKMVEMLAPIKNKILCAVSGNHERRSEKDADDNPMYDVMCKLNLEDVYRPNMAFLKLQFGKDNEQIENRQGITYTLAVTHGSGGGNAGATVSRNEKFGYTIDGLDCLIVGHSHKGTVSKPCKIVIDPRNNVINFKPFTVISCQSWLNFGGYALQKMLTPTSTANSDRVQKLCLTRDKKSIEIRW